MRTKGKLMSWNDEKGFGFITPNAGGKQVFVHINAFGKQSRRPEINEIVTYAISTDKQGRPCAVNATLAGARLPQKTERQNATFPVIGITIFFAILIVSVLTAKIPDWILALYFVASLLTFVMYTVDKRAAKKGTWRTPESTLHFLSLVGGWPGALIAQRKLRHKSTKQPFRSIYWVTVILNCGALAWLYTPTGAATLQYLKAGVA